MQRKLNMKVIDNNSANLFRRYGSTGCRVRGRVHIDFDREKYVIYRQWNRGESQHSSTWREL